MTNVIVAFATEEQCARCASALEAGGIPVSLRCTSFGGVRRAFDLYDEGVLVCACRLSDGTADDLAWDLGERAIVVAVGKAAQLETCGYPKLFRLRLPCSRNQTNRCQSSGCSSSGKLSAPHFSFPSVSDFLSVSILHRILPPQMLQFF